MADPRPEDEIRNRWPAYAWMLNVPDLKAILLDSSISLGDVELVQARIRDTAWYRGTIPAMRAWETKRLTDPASADQDRRQTEATIWDAYNAIGLQPDVGAVQTLSEQYLSMGWNKDQLNDAIVSQVKYTPDLMNQAGAIQTQATKLRQQALQYYVNISPETSFSWGRKIIAGEKSEADFMPDILNQAKSRFSHSPELVSAIDRGITVRDYLSPMQQDIAKTLEMNAEDVDLINDPQFSRITDFVDDKGQRRMMTWSEAQRYARGMDRWKGTEQGQKAAVDMVDTLTKELGVAA